MPVLLENQLPLPLLNYPPFSILLLQDYLVFLLFLLFPPTQQPLEMLAADFQGPSSLQLAGNLLPFGLNSRTPPRPLLHTQTGSEDLIAAGECREYVYFPCKSTFWCVCIACSLGHVSESNDLQCRFKVVSIVNYVFLFIATYKLQKLCENLGVKGYMFFPCQQNLWGVFFFLVPLYERVRFCKGPSGSFLQHFLLLGTFWVLHSRRE